MIIPDLLTNRGTKLPKGKLHHPIWKGQRFFVLLLIIGVALICSTTLMKSLTAVNFDNASADPSSERNRQDHEAFTALEKSHQKFLDIHMGRSVGRQQVKKKGARTVVAYSAPTSLDRGVDGDEENKNGLYLKNFEYFLDHGINCEKHSTLIIMTKPVAEKYGKQIEKMNSRECRRTQYSIDIIVRENKCYDMQSMHVFLEYDIATYDFFVYVNCGMVGPKTSGEVYWTNVFTSRLSDTIKLVGVSLNMVHHPHVQSFTLAFDTTGMEIIKEAGAVYDCAVENKDMTDKIRWEIVQRYEVGMSKAIVDAGYSISALVGAAASPIVINKCMIENIRTAAKEAFKDSKDPPVRIVEQIWTQYEHKFIYPWGDDLWYEKYISLIKKGKLPLWSDFVFFKSSRGFLLPGMLNEIGYDDEYHFDILGDESTNLDYLEYKTRVEESYQQFLDIQTTPKATICDDSASPVDNN